MAKIKTAYFAVPVAKVYSLLSVLYQMIERMLKQVMSCVYICEPKARLYVLQLVGHIHM